MSAPRVAPKRALEIDNAMRIGEDMASGRTEWQGRPFHVEISTNNACNLSCVMCERPDLSYISGDQFDAVGDVVFPNASVITPSATSPATSVIKGPTAARKTRGCSAFIPVGVNIGVISVWE